MIHPMGNNFHHIGFDFLQKDFKDRLHAGLDENGTGSCNSDLDLPVYAIHRGLIDRWRDAKDAWGGMLSLYHPDLKVWSIYAHVKEPVTIVTRWVEEGEQIAKVGNAHGRYCAHIHFEIRKTNRYLTYYPPKGTTKAEILKDYENPSAYIKKYNKEHKIMPNNPPHFDGKEVQQLYKSLKNEDLAIDKAIAISKKYSDKGHNLITKILQSEKYNEFEEKKKKYFRERSECIKEKDKLEKDASESCSSFNDLKPDLIASVNNLNDIIKKLK